MNEKSPTQHIYDETFKKALEVTEKVYDVLPLEEVGYPFINFGEVNSSADLTKGRMINNVNLDVHIWGNRKQRRLVNDLSYQLMNKLISVGLLPQKSKVKILTDSSTDEVLFHAVLDLEFEVR